MDPVSKAWPTHIGIESDILRLVPMERLAEVRLRVDNNGAPTPFPVGDWLHVSVAVRLFDPADAERGRFDEPLAAGAEAVVVARPDSWTHLVLALPRVIRREYAMAAKVYSADERYRELFEPSRCRVVRTTYGDVVRLEQRVLDDIYNHGGYGNPSAEAEIRRLVREGAVVTMDGTRLVRATELDGQLRLEPLAPS